MRKISSAKRRLVLAILAGTVAAGLMFVYVSNIEEQARSAHRAAIEEYGGARAEVLVATRDILSGEELSSENTTIMPWLASLLPKGSITDPSDAYGMTVAMPIWSNEPILFVKLGGRDELIQVPDGLTAVSIPLRDDMAVGGSLLPGSSVDVYAIGAAKVNLVLADVLVLEASNGVGAQQSGGSDQAGVVLGGSARAALKWVTLAVKDETVTELLHAARDNTLCLTLPGQNAGASMMHLLDEASELSYDDTNALDTLRAGGLD
ncbi:MAG: Flp pilus assembly protein CpaB [Coriobacteriia bacterium]|nr:Flp pilus assembly protein CpaB [Coriobacteriia bacterium]